MNFSQLKEVMALIEETHSDVNIGNRVVSVSASMGVIEQGVEFITFEGIGWKRQFSIYDGNPSSLYDRCVSFLNSPIKETLHKWSEVPHHINWIALDFDGFAYGYVAKPTPGVASWSSNSTDGSKTRKLTSLHRNGPLLNWRDSLEKRPDGATSDA